MPEADKNDSAEQRAVTIPGTLCGVIERAEDVDFFKFNVPANGSSISTFARCGCKIGSTICSSMWIRS